MPEPRDPFADILDLIGQLPEPDLAAGRAARAGVEARQSGLGALADLAEWLAGWRGGAAGVRRPVIALYIASQAGPGDPAGAAQARLEHLAAGGGAVSTLARALGAGVEVFDLASARPSPDPAMRPAMSAREAAATFAFGMEALAKEPDLLVLGDASADATPSAEALLAAISGEAAEGEAARFILERVQGEGAREPLDLLRQCGGRGTAAVFGALVAARTQRTAVLIDGAPALAAAAVLHQLRPDGLEHVVLGHAPAQPWARAAAARIGLEPLLDLGVTAGEGVGAASALSLVKLAGELAAV